MLYQNHLGDVKRYVALTSDTLLDNSLYEPEIYVKTFAMAVEYFTDVVKIKSIIDIYEEDDRQEGENTF